MKRALILTLTVGLSGQTAIAAPLLPGDCLPHDRELIQRVRARIERKDPQLFQSGAWLGSAADTLLTLQNRLGIFEVRRERAELEATQIFGERDRLAQGLAASPAGILGLREDEKLQLVTEIAQAATYHEIYASLRRYQQSQVGPNVRVIGVAEGLEVRFSQSGITTTTLLPFPMYVGREIAKLDDDITPLQSAMAQLQALGSCENIAAALSRPRVDLPKDLRPHAYHLIVAQAMRQVRCRTRIDFEVMLPIPTLNRQCETQIIPFERASARQRNEALTGMKRDLQYFERHLTRVENQTN